jgi:hypothetical protein
MHQPPYVYAESEPTRPRVWTITRISVWVFLFFAMCLWAFLIGLS